MQMQALMTSVTMPAKPCVGIAKGLGSSPTPLAVRSSRRAVLRTHAQPEDKQANGSIGLAEREDPSKAVAALDKLPTGDELEKVLKEMSPDQQKQLAQLYMFLTQHPEARVDVKKLGNVRQAMSANNQVLLWRPAELLNGRMAMIGFVAALANEAITGASLWQQLYFAPYAYFSAYFLVAVAAQLNKAFGRPQQGIGPFTRYAEIINGRAAMLGYVILAYVEYNQELRNAASIMYSRIQQQGGIGL